ncbi:MAG: 16S rRNA (uracil(1498)-N(3))-methyltransferase [Treponema sp.]|nr:16S rRNA (uracil(1498)-N(3))-methyltransferase [Treponema sp.]
MKRFVLSSPPNPEGVVRLYAKDYHYLVRVRRLKPGSHFNALLPDGTEVLVSVSSLADNILIGQCSLPPKPLCVQAEKTHPQTFPLGESRLWAKTDIPPIVLIQGLPKGAKMDTIVRQAAEGGVFSVVPFQSEHSTARPNAEKLKRWERIVKEARQQSGSAVQTSVLPPVGFEQMLEYWEAQKKSFRRPLSIVLHQEPLEKGSFHDYIRCNPDIVALAVGPEGGFSHREVSKFAAAGFKPLLMGNTILRVDTAALYGTAALRIILLESESWMSGE